MENLAMGDQYNFHASMTAEVWGRPAQKSVVLGQDMYFDKT